MVKSELKMKNSRAAAITGIAVGTLDNWFNGSTRRPQNATVSQVAAALGYVRRDEFKANGEVAVGFVKARDYDYAKEIEKQADWLLKQGKKKRPAKKKTNGSR
jgi:hypothetical protein